MKITNGLRALAPIAKRGGQILKAKSPTALVVTGIVSGIVATVVAVKRAPLCEEVKTKFDERMTMADDALNSNAEVTLKNGTIVKYDDHIFRKDIRTIYIQKYVGYVKVFAPSVIIGAISITSILVSHGIMMKRNAALTATVASLSEAFHRYRENVRAEYGDEVDYNMRHNLVCEKVKTKETDPVTGETKNVTKILKKQREGLVPWRSDYARLYEDGCRNWSKDPNANRLTLLGFQAWANQKLKTDGFLFLNDVYDLLGIDKTLAGHTMGWIYTKSGENPHGDNFVDFGFEKERDFISGFERSVWLDFNVDDLPISDRITWRIK